MPACVQARMVSHQRGGNLILVSAPLPCLVCPQATPETNSLSLSLSLSLQGQELMILEAMKMEHTIPAPFAGRVGMVSHMVGDLVDEGSVLVTLEAPDDRSK